MNSSKELKIINEVLSGNTNAFTHIVNNYKDLVFTLSIRLLKDKEKAEDVSQDVFIKIFKNLANFKGNSKFSSWIYRITYNTCLDELRKQKKKYNEVSITEKNEHELSSFENVMCEMEEVELKNNLKKCLDLLPAEDSFLLTLFYYEDLSLKEISDIVGHKTNTVKVKIHRSRQKLLQIVNKNLEPDLISSYGKK